MSTTLTIDPVLIQAGAERHGVSRDPGNNVTSLLVTILDNTPAQWVGPMSGGTPDLAARTAAGLPNGFIKRWGIQATDATGAVGTFSWTNLGAVPQGDPANSSTWLAFGQMGGKLRNQMPAIHVERSIADPNNPGGPPIPGPVAPDGVRLRLAIEVSADITIGATVQVN